MATRGSRTQGGTTRHGPVNGHITTGRYFSPGGRFSILDRRPRVTSHGLSRSPCSRGRGARRAAGGRWCSPGSTAGAGRACDRPAATGGRPSDGLLGQPGLALDRLDALALGTQRLDLLIPLAGPDGQGGVLSSPGRGCGRCLLQVRSVRAGPGLLRLRPGDRFFQAGPVPGHRLFHVPGEVVIQMPPVGDLDCLRAPWRAPSNGTVRYQNCPNACCRHARIGRSGRVMRRLGQAASRSQVLRCQGCSGVEKAILATTTP